METSHPIRPCDIFHLRAAQGWLELGDHLEARGELAQLNPRLRAHPDVLEISFKVYALAKQWRSCLRLADSIVRSAPERATGWIYLSAALHSLRSTEEAWETLLDVVYDFPDVPAIPYELARYACCLRMFREARDWLEAAFAAGDAQEIKTMALEDPDFEPLRSRIAHLGSFQE